MPIQLKILKKPNIKSVKMMCDGVIDKKLLRYPMVEDCFSKNHFTIIIGKMGQGKTSLSVQLIRDIFANCYESIYVFMPEESRNDLEHDIFGENLKPEQIYSELTSNDLDELYDILKANKEQGENSLVLIDDFQNIFKNKDIEKSLEKLVIKLRHINTSIILLQQNFQKLPKKMRSLVFNIICFDLGKEELQEIFDEVIKKNRNQYNELLEFCFNEPHNWICVNTKSRKIYKKFDEIVFN
jgi:KaiC/GvpD/RAD55 family RecA-like ATPase